MFGGLAKSGRGPLRQWPKQIDEPKILSYIIAQFFSGIDTLETYRSCECCQQNAFQIVMAIDIKNNQLLFDMRYDVRVLGVTEKTNDTTVALFAQTFYFVGGLNGIDKS